MYMSMLFWHAGPNDELALHVVGPAESETVAVPHSSDVVRSLVLARCTGLHDGGSAGSLANTVMLDSGGV